MKRVDGRAPDQIRPVYIEPNYLRHPLGSVLIKQGDTWVICSAQVENQVPHFINKERQGWLTAEYNMLPGSGNIRVNRGTNSRAQEIQRLIGRSLRSALSLNDIIGYTITVDCDVLQADGGTRTTAITGGYIALALALKAIHDKGWIKKMPALTPIAAVSVGIINQNPLLDLCYTEDVAADVDMNIVMSEQAQVLNFIEIQGTAEKKSFNHYQLNALLTLAEKGIHSLRHEQQTILGMVLK